MKLSSVIVTGVAALSLVGVAVAQGQTINDYVREMIESVAEPGENLVDEIVLEEVMEGESLTVTYSIDPDLAYFVYAACDDDCSDIDLYAEDADGEIVDSDVEDDDAPVLMIAPGGSGSEITITLEMSTCETDICVAGIGLYEVEG